MANNTFLPTGFTVTSSYQKLSDLLAGAGITTGDGFTASQDGYIRNNDASIDLRIGQGTSEPTKYATVGPKSAVAFNAGLNPALVWLKCASSTITCDFVEGATAYIPPLVNGVIGNITATENTVPKADADGNLVASSISDDGTLVTIGENLEVAGNTTFDDDVATGGGVAIGWGGGTSGITNVVATGVASGTLTLPAATDTLVGKATTDELSNKTLVAAAIKTGLTASGSASNDFSSSTGTFKTSSGANTLSGAVTVNDATTPSITLASGKTNTGFLQINGKTSGALKVITDDATARTVTLTVAPQTVGNPVLTIPDQLGVSSNILFSNQFLQAVVGTPATNATNVMANITDLTLSVKAAGVYVGTMVIKCANNTAAEGIAFDFNGGNATMTAFNVGAGVLTGGTTVAVNAVSSALNTKFDWSTITGETWLTFQITLTVNAAGTLIPRFSESTAHTSGTATISAGSYISIRMVA